VPQWLQVQSQNGKYQQTAFKISGDEAEIPIICQCQSAINVRVGSWIMVVD